MRKSLLIVLTLLCGFAVFAQKRTMRGVVYDAKFKTPVAFAAVFIEDSRFGTVANSMGQFSFSAPDSLINRNLVISGKGFVMMQIPIELVAASSIDIFLERDESHKNSGFLQKALDFVMNDWLPLGNPETNRFDFGRLQTIPTYNPIEGLRLRAGVASNSRLSPHFFIKGYGAYGFGDRKFKYRGEAVYSFNKKAYHDEEFPKNNLRFIYENDIYSPGEMHPRANNDLLLMTYRRSENETTYRNFTELNYEREYGNGFSHLFWMRKSSIAPQGNLIFERLNHGGNIQVEEINWGEAGVSVRFFDNEAYSQQKRNKELIDYTGSLLQLSHSIGLKNFLRGEHHFHRSELSVQRRLLFRDHGRLDMVAEVAKIWNGVPFPLLVYPNQRSKFHVENNAFFLNRSLEFVADEQVTFRAVFVGDELWLSKSNVLNAFGVKELVSMRASYGNLSDKNRPNVNNGLFNFLPGMHEYTKSTPYVEGTIGITNILGLLRLEYVHRFTYRNIPGAINGAVRLDITI